MSTVASRSFSAHDLLPESGCTFKLSALSGKRDSINHQLLEAISETATVLESRQKPLYATPLWVVVVVVVVVVYKFPLPIVRTLGLRNNSCIIRIVIIRLISSLIIWFVSSYLLCINYITIIHIYIYIDR